MRTLLEKELRENLGLSLIGLLIFAALLVLGCRDCTGPWALSSVAPYDSRSVIVQPLLASFLLREIAIVCAVFGSILGWLQIYRERHRDLWAFLVHRPLSRTRILLAKLCAGGILYAAVTGLPLVAMVIWVSVPGHVFAPFQWSMVWPVAGCFLAGIVYYLAGMVTALRQARWYASRGLALGLGLAVTGVTIVFVPSWWIVPVAVVVGGGVLAVAVWGSFLTGGAFRPQVPVAKAALAGGLTFGTFMVLTFITALVVNAVQRSSDYTSFYYQMGKNGTVYRWSHLAGQPAQVETLDGEPARDPKTGQVVGAQEIGRWLAPGYTLRLDFAGAPRPARNAWDSARFFQIWQASPQEAWYYWDHNHHVVGFDVTSGRPIGALGPNGFSSRAPRDGAGFRPPVGQAFTGRRTLTTPTGVYAVSVENRTVRSLFTTPPTDPIGGSLDIGVSGDWDYTLVGTRRSIVLITPKGQTVWNVAREPSTLNYAQVNAYFLEGTNQFALWLSPPYGSDLPTSVLWLNAQGEVTRRAELPPLPSPRFTGSVELPLLTAAWPPVVSLVFGQRIVGPGKLSELFGVCLGVAALCAAVGWWLGRRYAFPARAQLGWSLFHLVFGLPGLLTFLAVEEWPARERCPSCQRRRVVIREQCEHCGAEFAPPPRTGTEIFGPETAEQSGVPGRTAAA